MEYTSEEIIEKIKAGESGMLIVLWDHVRNWVAKTALRWHRAFNGGRGVEVSDLIQSGYIAMVDAVQTYTEGNGSFLTWLTFYLQREFAVLYGVRTERARHDPLNAAVSLDAPLSDDDPEGAALIDTIVDPCGEDEFQDIEQRDYIRSMREALEAALNDIPPKNADTIRRRYFDGQTQTEIARDCGVSTQLIQQREKDGLRQLRNPKTLLKLREFNYYSGTGFTAWKQSGMSIEEKWLIMKEHKRVGY